MELDKSKLEEFKSIIAASRNAVIVGHFNPDGDAVGSAVALYRYLEESGKQATIVFPNEYPLSLRPIAGDARILIVSEAEKAVRAELEQADLLLNVDFNAYKRTCEQIEDRLVAMQCPKITIDHHEKPDIGGLLFSDPAASSTCELVYKILSAVGGEKMNDACLTAIYAGICTDTGSFSHSCSRRDVFDVAAELVARGVNVSRVKRQVVDLSSENRLRLLGFMLKEKMRVFPDKGAAYMAVSKKELRAFDFKKGDIEGVVNYMLRIDGIRFAALVSERGDKVRMSFRSLSPEVDVNRFAARYWEGGGHVQAAGGTSSLGLELTCRILEQQIEKRAYEKA